ncbi:MAG TPA: glycosyltransferase [Ktedonobacterales bacterium]|nr:glycosyltransferase [Ktedonobacterales bacterium]
MQDLSQKRSDALSSQWTPQSRVALMAIVVLLILSTVVGALGVVSHKLEAPVLLIPVLLAFGLLAGLYTPRLSLILLFVMITLEFFYPALLPSGDVHIRIDGILGLAVSGGTFIRHINNGTAKRLLRRVPGRLPAALLVLESLLSTLINRQFGSGLPLVAELAVGLMCYAAIVFIVSELTNATFILWALLPIAAIEAAFGILAYGASRVFQQPALFGVRVDTSSGLLSAYGTFSEQNFFGHYLVSVTVLVVAVILGLLVRGRLFTPLSLALALVAALCAAGGILSLTRASWLGFILGAIIVAAVTIWVRGKLKRDVPASMPDADNSTNGHRNAHRLPIVIGFSLLGVAIVAVAFLLLIHDGSPISTRMASLLNFQSGSGGNRVKVVSLVVDEWTHSPIWGRGTATYYLFEKGSPHNYWIFSMGLSILHFSGIIGVALILWFLAALYAAVLRTIRRPAPTPSRAITIGMLGAMTCMLFCAQATSSMYLMLLWVFLGLAAAMPTLAESLDEQARQRQAMLRALPAGAASGDVIHIIDSGALGGGPRVLLSAARGLMTYGWRSKLICGDDGPLAENARRAGIAAQAQPIAGQLRFARAGPRLAWRLSRARPDALLVYGPIAGCLAGLAGRVAGIDTIVYSAGYPSYYADRDLYRRVRNAVVEKIACSCASAIWCKSQADVDLYHARKASLPEKFALIPNSVSEDVLARLHALTSDPEQLAETRQALANTLGVAGDGPVVVFVGRLVPEKGVAVLVEAFAQLLSGYPTAKLVIVGDGPDRASLEALARRLQIARSVVFAGARNDVAPFYLLADVVAIPSLSEPFGIVAVEAMAAGRPVVASNVGGLADTVVDGQTGRLAPPGDAPALAEALAWVLQSPERAQQLGVAAHARAIDDYSEDRLAASLHALLCRGTLAMARRKSQLAGADPSPAFSAQEVVSDA